MFRERGWTVYTKLLTFAGVLPLYGSYKNYLVSFIILQSAIILILIFNYRWTSQMNAYGIIGRESELYQYICNCVKQQVLHLWLLCNSKHFINTLKTISECERRYCFANNSNHMLTNLKINVICTMTYVLDITLIKYANSIGKTKMFTRTYSLVMLTYEIDFFRWSLLLTFYTALAHKIQDIIEMINKRLEVIIISVWKTGSKVEVCLELSALLDVRNRLLTLCVLDISYYFGFCILLISMEFFVEIMQAPFYFTFDVSDDLSFEIENKLTMTLWFSVKMIVFSRAFLSDSIGKEVSLFHFIYMVSV